MKRFAAELGIALAIAFCLLLCSCKTPPQTVMPSLPGCALTITALGTRLVSGMDWTNLVTGHSGVGGQSISIPEAGTIKINVYAHPDISCATNLPNIAMAQWNCKTNPPIYQFWQLPSACNGFQRTVTTDCSNCLFSVSQSIGFDCYIYGPK